MDLIDLGQLIKKGRSEANLTQRQLADKVKVTVSYISMLEIGKNPKTGRPSRPSYGLLRRLAQALDLDLKELKDLAGYIDPVTSYVRTSPYETDDLDGIKKELKYTKLLDDSETVRTMMYLFEKMDMPPRKRAKIDAEVASFARWKIDTILKSHE